jgi:hypothetical protein
VKEEDILFLTDELERLIPDKIYSCTARDTGFRALTSGSIDPCIFIDE